MSADPGQGSSPKPVVGLLRFLLVIILTMSTVAVSAQSIFTSTGGGGDWTDPNSWSENNQGNPDDSDGVPDGNDNVIITSGNPIDIATGTGQNVEDLTLNSGILTYTVASADLDVEGTLTITGTSSIIAGALITDARMDHQGSTFNVSTGATATIGAIRFDSNGTTTIDGTLSFTSTTGVKNFTNITVNNGGTWDNGNVTESFNIDGDIIANTGSTWTGCSDATSCRYTMRATASSISGSGTVNMPDLRVNTPDVCTNTGNLVMTDNIDGSGTFINGNGGTLTLSENGNYSITTFTLNTVGNTVIYAGGTNESMLAGPYYDLEVNMDASNIRAQVNGNDVTVNNNLTLTQGFLRLQTANTLTVSGDMTITGGELSPNITGSALNVTGDIVMSGGDYDHNAGTVTITDDFLITGGTLNIAAGALNMDQMTMQDATFTMAGGTITASNASANGITLNAAGVILLNAATLNVTNDLSIANATAEFSPNNASAIANISGDLLMSNGLYDQNNGDVNVTGNATISGGTLTMDNSNSTFDVTGTYQVSGGTNDFNAGTFAPSTMTIDASQAATFGGLTVNAGNTATINGTLTIDGNGGDKNFTNVTLGGSGNLNFTANETATLSGDLSMSGTSSITGTSNNQIVNVTGTFDVTSGTGSIGGIQLNVTGLTTAAGTLAITSGTGTKTLDDLTVSGSGVVNFTANETLTVGGDLTMSGTSSLTGTANGQIINVTGAYNIPSGTASIGGIQLNVTGTTTVTGNMSITSGTGSKNLGNATVNGSGNINFTASETLSIGGDLTMLGTSSITGTSNAQIISVTGGFNVTSGTASIGGVRFNVGGDTTLDGQVNFTSTTGGKTFTNITVNGSGNWNNGTVAEDFTVSGNITNNGTWTGCSSNGCNYTLTSNSGSISGSGAMNATSDLLIDNPASYTNTNTGGLNVTDRITGTGTFINGASGLLSYSGNNSSGTNFDIFTFTASATGNTVTYSRAGDQQLRATSDTDNNYHNLVINTDAAGDDVTLADNITVDNQLTLTTGDIILSTFRLTMADGATISGGSGDSFISINSTGVLRQVYSAAGATLAFPIGDNNDYSPITAFTILSATFGASPYLEFTITDADHPNRDTSNTPTGDDDGTAASAYISRYWTVSPNDITSPRYDASYQYVDADVTGTEADMVAAVYRLHPIVGVLDWLVKGVVNATTNTVFLSNADAFGDMYAMDNTLNRLPITLLSFEARPADRVVVLEWVTASETNNSFFTVERSADGRTFEPILTLAGAGNSNSEIAYRAEDSAPLDGRNFYRLKQTDFNGTFTYSEVVSVILDLQDMTFDFRLGPNPINVGNTLNIFLAQGGDGLLTIIGSNGQQYYQSTFARVSGSRLSFMLPTSLRPGVYLVRLMKDGQSETKRLIVN